MALEALRLHPLEPDRFREEPPGRQRLSGPQPVTRALGHGPASTDRLDLSSEAQEAATHPATPDLAYARKAMQGIPPLSEERRVDVIRRIQSGYARWPGILEYIADRIRASYLVD